MKNCFVTGQLKEIISIILSFSFYSFFMSYWGIALVAVFFLLATLFLTLKLYSGQNVGKIVLIYLKKKYFH